MGDELRRMEKAFDCAQLWSECDSRVKITLALAQAGNGALAVNARFRVGLHNPDNPAQDTRGRQQMPTCVP